MIQVAKTTERLPTVKQEAFAAAMYTIGSLTLGNGTESARAAGHKGTDNYLARVASENVRNCKIIKLRDAIQADTKERAGITKQTQLDKLAVLHAMAIKQGNVAAGRSVIHEENELCGLLQDKAPNTEKQAAQLQRMSSETKRLAEQLALILTRKAVDSTIIDAPSTDVEPIRGKSSVDGGLQ